ncbi:MAG: hypothetical protein AAGN35_27715 [Bacteroidota bacterium]
MNEETQAQARKQIKGYFRQLNTLFGVFLASILLFLLSVLIVVYYQGALESKYATFLLIAAPVSGAALLIMGYRLFLGRLQGARTAEKLYEKMESYRSAMVLRMILLDGAAFIQLVAYVMTGNKLFIALAVALASIFMLYKPGLEKFIKDLDLSEMEARVMRDHRN